jgi:hypothetical protein
MRITPQDIWAGRKIDIGDYLSDARRIVFDDFWVDGKRFLDLDTNSKRGVESGSGVLRYVGHLGAPNGS